MIILIFNFQIKKIEYFNFIYNLTEIHMSTTRDYPERKVSDDTCIPVLEPESTFSTKSIKSTKHTPDDLVSPFILNHHQNHCHQNHYHSL